MNVDDGPKLLVVNGDFNPWKLTSSNPSYDPHEFYVRSTNKHDHSETVSLRIPGDVLAEWSGIVASERYPMYHTKSDFLRDAVVHRLNWIADEYQDEDLLRWVKQEQMLARIEALDRETALLTSIVKGWKVRVQAAKDAKDAWAVQQARKMIQEDIDEVREPYRGQLVELLDGLNKLD